MADEPTTGFYENPWGQEPTTIIFPGKNAGDPPRSFIFDATVNLTTTAKGTLTKYPIERGSIVSDHFQPEQLRLDISGVISESPSNFALTLLSNFANFATYYVASSRVKGSVETGLAAIAAGAVGTVPYLLASKKMGRLTKAADYIDVLTSRPVQESSDGFTATNPDKNYPKRAMKALILMLRAAEPFTVRTHFSEALYTDMIMTSVSFPQESAVGESLAFNMSCNKVEFIGKLRQRADQFQVDGDIANSKPKDKANGTKKKKKPPPKAEDDVRERKRKDVDKGSWFKRVGF